MEFPKNVFVTQDATENTLEENLFAHRKQFAAVEDDGSMTDVAEYELVRVTKMKKVVVEGKS